MNVSDEYYLTSPKRFAEWVLEIAVIQEQFSEVLRDTADIVAPIDPRAAIGLYRAADQANQTVQALRTAMPRRPQVPRARLSTWIIFGWICALLGYWL